AVVVWSVSGTRCGNCVEPRLVRIADRRAHEQDGRASGVEARPRVDEPAVAREVLDRLLGTCGDRRRLRDRTRGQEGCRCDGRARAGHLSEKTSSMHGQSLLAVVGLSPMDQWTSGT